MNKVNDDSKNVVYVRQKEGIAVKTIGILFVIVILIILAWILFGGEDPLPAHMMK